MMDGSTAYKSAASAFETALRRIVLGLRYAESQPRVPAPFRANGEEPDDGYVLGDYAYSCGEVHERAGNMDKAPRWYRIARYHNPEISRFREAADRFTSVT